MKKKVIEALDYSECTQEVQNILGYDIRDVNGRFKKDGNRMAEYRDWWHYLIEQQEVHNGCLIWIGSEMLGAEPWQDEITQCFIDTFGDDQQYWVEW